MSIKFTPATFIMFFVAVTIDILGYVILFCGLDDFGILDFTWIAFSLPWLIFKGKGPAKKPGLWGWLQGIFTNKWGKFLTPGIGGLVPYLGNIIPFRTLSALFNSQD